MRQSFPQNGEKFLAVGVVHALLYEFCVPGYVRKPACAQKVHQIWIQFGQVRWVSSGHQRKGFNAAILSNDRVSFCVIAQDEVMPKTFSTRYRSAIVFGRARILTEDSERRYALECLVEKYSPGFIEEGQREIESAWDRVCLVEVKIEHMTGKTAKELVETSPAAS